MGSQNGESVSSPSFVANRASRQTRAKVRQKKPPGPETTRGHPLIRKTFDPQRQRRLE
jgi:hypothetical protein